MSEQQRHQQQEMPNRQEEHEQEPRVQPRIYVASLSDYNAGRLHGQWLDAAEGTPMIEPPAMRVGVPVG